MSRRRVALGKHEAPPPRTVDRGALAFVILLWIAVVVAIVALVML
jgi:hypothetical protein